MPLKELLHHMHGFTHVWHMYLLIYMYMYMYYVRAYIHFKIYSGGVRHSENFCMDEIVEISVGALKFCMYTTLILRTERYWYALLLISSVSNSCMQYFPKYGITSPYTQLFDSL